MTKPREKNREELTTEIEGGKKKIRQLENHEKVLRTLKNAHHNLIPGSKSYTVEINSTAEGTKPRVQSKECNP